MKIIVLAILFAVLTINTFSQDKKDDQKQLTKMDVFASKTGTIERFIDYKLPDLKNSFGSLESRIRAITIGNQTQYFFQIVKKGEYTNSTASIEYSDLLEIVKAMGALRTAAIIDGTSNPDYLENKFVTDDGFQVGYYVDGSKLSWYLRLEKYGSDNTVFIKDGDYLTSVFGDAKTKIELVKK